MIEVGDSIFQNNGIYTRQLALNTSLRLVSIRADIQVLSMTDVQSQPVVTPSERCFLVFTGETSTTILISNVVR